MQFTRNQRTLAIKAMDEAEQHTTRYYCIPPYRWEKLQFDMLTRQDHEWEPLPETALARIRRLVRPASPTLATCDFFRIELNDPLIMDAAARTGLISDFYPLLVYIITHEMVHLVRLSTILDDAPPGKCFRESEEHRVQQICSQILAGLSKFRPILEQFCIHSIPGSNADATAGIYPASSWPRQMQDHQDAAAFIR